MRHQVKLMNHEYEYELFKQGAKQVQYLIQTLTRAGHGHSPCTVHGPSAIHQINGQDTIVVLTQSEIGRITVNTPGKMTTHVTVDGVTHIMMPGKQINGMMELIQVIGTLMQAPISDGMNEMDG